MNHRDSLTGTYNRRFFTGRLREEFERHRRYKRPMSLIMFDLDHFKEVNDTYGHPAGDVALAEVAQVVTGLIRAEDVFARVGGEEFAVICRTTDGDQATAVAERMRQTVLGHAFESEGKRLPIAISAGTASIPHPDITDPQGLIAAADQALYQAKRTGRNRVCAWQGS